MEVHDQQDTRRLLVDGDAGRLDDIGEAGRGLVDAVLDQHLRLGQVGAQRKGDVERALADYAQAIALEPENALAYLNRGQVYENTLQKDPAVADYKSVLALVCEESLKEEARKRLMAMGVRIAPPSPALAIWQKKLIFLQAEEAKASDADQKFSIQQRIEEAQAKIRELGG